VVKPLLLLAKNPKVGISANSDQSLSCWVLECCKCTLLSVLQVHQVIGVLYIITSERLYAVYRHWTRDNSDPKHFGTSAELSVKTYRHWCRRVQTLGTDVLQTLTGDTIIHNYYSYSGLNPPCVHNYVLIIGDAVHVNLAHAGAVAS